MFSPGFYANVASMDLTSRKIIKDLLERHEFSPNKRLGQNFLVSTGALDKIIATARIKSKDTVLEIGPGLGVLTQELLRQAKQVVAVEKDLKTINILEETFKEHGNLKLFNGDILKIPLSRLSLPKKYKIVANLPYYITAPTIRRFLEGDRPPEEMILTIQKEVAQKICGKASCPNKQARMSLLAVSVQIYAQTEIAAYISRKSFYPQPKVDAAVIKISPYKNPLLPKKIISLFFQIVKAGFSQPRKQLANTLSGGLGVDKKVVTTWLENNNISPKQRAETLSIQNWINLTESFSQP